MTRHLRILLIALGLSVTAVAPGIAAPLPVAVTRDAAFTSWFNGLSKSIATDRKYRRIPFDTDAQAHEFVV